MGTFIIIKRHMRKMVASAFSTEIFSARQNLVAAKVIAASVPVAGINDSSGILLVIAAFSCSTAD